jgi:peroxiredoxin
LAIDVGQSEEHIRNFVNRLKTTFPIYMDRDGKVARSFGVKGLPTYFITDRQGVVRHIILGWADEKILLQQIAKIDREWRRLERR